jgi:hypothetical protein
MRDVAPEEQLITNATRGYIAEDETYDFEYSLPAGNQLFWIMLPMRHTYTLNYTAHPSESLRYKHVAADIDGAGTGTCNAIRYLNPETQTLLNAAYKVFGSWNGEKIAKPGQPCAVSISGGTISWPPSSS